jgi:hypothetical protein
MDKLRPPDFDGENPHIPTLEEMRKCYYAFRAGSGLCPNMDKEGRFVRIDGANCGKCILRNPSPTIGIFASVREHAICRKT